MSRLVVFDIDGTLTDTNSVDDECYLHAMERTLGVDCGAVDWLDAPHVTDGAIATWLWAKHRGSRPAAEDLDRLRDTFVTSLRDEIARAPGRCLAVPGAVGLFSDLQQAGWAVAIATGGWKMSARLKLEIAGLLDGDAPMACADDGMSRSDIIQLAVRRASERYARDFERIVSVGDAAWDVMTARDLQLPFVGVAGGERAQRLRAAGASTVIVDFSDRQAVLAALATARPPKASMSSTATT